LHPPPRATPRRRHAVTRRVLTVSRPASQRRWMPIRPRRAPAPATATTPRPAPTVTPTRPDPVGDRWDAVWLAWYARRSLAQRTDPRVEGRPEVCLAGPALLD